ncbi:TPA: zinc-ribbon domain-containing protein [Clostridium perfringens]
MFNTNVDEVEKKSNYLAIKRPDLANEWNTIKNGDLTPYDVTCGSGKKVWWKCVKGHEWKAVIGDRVRGNGCPYCSGKRVTLENCLAVVNFELVKEWNQDKNGEVTPYEVSYSSNKKVWWKCSKGHEWKAAINNRNQNRGCPYCSNQKVCEDNCLSTIKPELVKEWNYEKNGELTPDNVVAGSNKKVWWKCSNGHEWEAAIGGRVRGSRCPYCLGQKVCKDNCLANINPELSKDWHPKKNGELTPYNVTLHSNKKVWWKCSNGHEWEATINNRSKGKGCPFCLNKRVYEDNCLANVNPELVKEWNSNRNKDLTPYDVIAGSKKKIWWKCEKGHEWKASVAHRNNGTGCPYCSNQKVCEDNCLANINPELSKEWHKNKNGKTTPYNIVARSTKKVWWKCDKGHEWQATVVDRNSGKGCPYCANRYVNIDNCLANLRPELAEEWHKNKNGGLTPYDVVPGSGKKVWWKCKRGHEWQSVISSRNNGTGCPHCYGEQTSFPEQAICFYLKKIFQNLHNRYKYDGIELDIFIEEINLGIEYDGVKFHSEEVAVLRDLRKNKLLSLKDVKFFRIREAGCPEIDMRGFDYIIYNTSSYYSNFKNLMIEILEKIKEIDNRYSEDILRIKNKIDINKDRFKILKQYKYINHINKEDIRYNQLLKEWNYIKNEDLKLSYFKKNSKEYAWWKCEKGHEWKAVIGSRYSGTGCPYCSNQKVCIDNCMANTNPELAKEWHPSKNGKLTAYDVVPGSGKKVWWKCERGHEWKASISSRYAGLGCPYCSNKKVSEDNCLANINPKLAKEWHPSKNGELTPYDVVCGSGKKVWWKCEKGHKWEVSVHNRAKGSSCPYCSNKKVSEDNCLAHTNPELAKEWHPDKNGKLTPYDVLAGSGKKVWWKCEKGHEWQARICNRNSGSKCHYCTGQKVTIDKSLARINPELAKEWHPSKNGEVTPEILGHGSHKKVWWKCKKGHEWQANIYSRSAGSGCPECYKLSRTSK